MNNVKWQTLGIAETEEILKTNAASGLSRKAARSRLGRSGGNSFFFVRTKSFGGCVRSVLSDPMLLLLAGVIAVAAIFGETAVALSAGVIVLLNIAIAFLSYTKSQRIIESMSGYSQPKVRVIRDGELYLVDSQGIVTGDVLLLDVGDILPCDARLVSGNSLKVEVYTGKNAENKSVTVEPDATQIYSDEINLEFFEYRNMLYAGSVILSGEARALVVETGDNTYIGALEGGLPLNDSTARHEILQEMKRFSSVYSFIALLMILPLTVIGIFSYGSDNLLNTFMLTLSLAVSSLGELIYVIGNIIIASSLYNSAVRCGNRGGAMIKSVSRTGFLAKTDRVVLIGDAALTDGFRRVVAVYANGRELRGREMFATGVIRLSEYALMLTGAAAVFPSAGGEYEVLPKGINGFCERLGVDRDGISIRASALSFTAGSRSVATLNDSGRIIDITVSSDGSLIDTCITEMIGGEPVTLSGERRTAIKKAFFGFVSEGCDAFIITSRTPGGTTVFEGVFAFRAVILRNAGDIVASLTAAGIKTVLLSDYEGNGDVAAALDSGVVKNRNSIAFASAYHAARMSINSAPEECRAFLGFSAGEQLSFIKKLKSEGHTVTVFASSSKSYPAFSCADFCVTCDRAVYRTGKDALNKLEYSIPTGTGESPDGAQYLRYSADMLVRRADLRGGGIEGIRNAVTAVRTLGRNLSRAVTYLLGTQLMRFVFVIPAMLCGKILLSPFQLLFSGLLLDMGAMLVFAFDKPDNNTMNGIYARESLKKPLKTCRDWLLCSCVSAAVGAICAILLSFICKCDVSGAVFASLTLTQLIALFFIRFDAKKPGKLTNTLIAEVITAVLIVVACALIPKLSEITGTVFSPLSFICLPLAPIVFTVWQSVSKNLPKK